MPYLIKILWHVKKKKTPQNSSVGYISKAAYISWTMDSIWFTQESLAWKPDWWADNRLCFEAFKKRIKYYSFKYFSTDWQQRDWAIVIDYLFVTFLMNRAYIRFLPYIWKYTLINTISEEKVVSKQPSHIISTS